MNYIFSLTINTAQDLTRKKNKRPSPLTSFQGLSVCPGNHGNQTVFWPQHLLPSCAPPPARRGGAWTPSGSSGRPPVAGDPRGLYWGSGTSHCCRNGPLTVPHGQLDHGQSLKDIEWKNGSVLSNRLTSFKQRCPHIVTFPPHQLSIKWMETTHQYMCMLNITTYNIPHCYFLSFNKLSKIYYF